MNTRQKGEIAQLHVLLRAAEKGLTVSTPTTQARYDFIVDDGQALERVQVKWGGRKSQRSDGAVSIDLRKDPHTKTKGRTVYRKGEVDSLMIFIPELGVVRLPPESFIDRPAISLRITPTKNGQLAGVTFAKDFLW